MSEEEINKILDTIPKTKTINATVGLYNSINVEDLESAMKRLKKVPNLNELLKENKNLQQRIDKAIEYIKECKDETDDSVYEIDSRIKNYGINSVSVAINNFDFSEAYNQAIEQKAVSEQNVLTAQQELEKAKVEAEKKVVEAEATNKANELLKQNVTDEVLMKQFIEKWNGQLPTTYAGNDILSIFNIK